MMRPVLIFLLLILGVSPLFAAVFGEAELAREAQAFAENLVAEEPAPGAAREVPGLLRWAAEFDQEGSCEAAYALRRKALQRGLPADYSSWLALGQSAACAKRHADASRAFWLAEQGASNLSQRVSALRQLGLMLESRHNWQQDWKGLASRTYAKLLVLTEDAEVRERLNRIRGEQPALLFQGVVSDQQGGSLSLCLDFNQWLNPDTAGETVYRDFVRFEPDLPGDLLLRDGKLCAAGARFGTAYSVSLLEGLPYGALKLANSLEYQVEPIARQSRVWFKDSAYVLSHNNRASLPMSSVNLEKTRLLLYRINERNMLAPFVQDQFRRRLDRDALRQMEEQVGELLWQQDLSLEQQPNQIVETAVQLPEDLLREPGLYVLQALTAELLEQEYWEEDAIFASQWLVVTDIGLTSYQGQGGLTVQARSLGSGKPLAGVRLSLMARNNKPLAEQVTGDQGLARFDAGLLQGRDAQRAEQIVAVSAAQGFSMLSLQRAALDLSDRGVTGRAFPGPLDAYLYTEQGIYRAGASVNLVGLLRDASGAPTAALPLTLRVLNPYGDPLVERVVQPSANGAYVERIDLPANARTGTWRIALFAEPQGSALGETRFQVEAIAPPRIEARVDLSQAVRTQHPAQAEIEVNYLYGAPAADLRVQAELLLLRSSRPFEGYSEYHFGEDGDEVDGRHVDRIALESVQTDAQGRAQLQLALRPGLRESQPLQGRLQLNILDVDGRSLNISSAVSVHQLPRYLGIKAEFPDQRVEANAPARFALINLDEEGKPSATAPLNWRLVAEHSHYQWYQRNGRWSYDRVVYDSPVDQGQTGVSDNGHLSLQVAVSEGDYRLELTDPDSTVLTSLRFRAGDFVVGESDTPDAVELTLDRSEYQNAEQAQLKIRAPFAGEASLMLVTDRVHEVRSFAVTEQAKSLDIPVDAAWGPGAYVLVTVYRPASDQHQARRAVGIVWLNLSDRPHRLALTLDAPDSVRPRQQIDLPLRIQGLQPGETVELTLAAVDDAVLQLTGFTPPDPLDYFFGKRRLGVDIRDLYANLIPRPSTSADPLRVGGGDPDAALQGMPIGNIEVLSRFSGLLQADAQGGLKVPLELPDFNGRVRLMAVAWSRERLASLNQTLNVSDPLVVVPSLPRFLTVDDRSELSLLLDNLEAPAGRYQVELLGDDLVEVDPVAARQTLDLQQKQRAKLRFALVAHAMGSSRLQLNMTGPEGFSYQRELVMGVRGKFFPVTERSYRQLQPNEGISLGSQALQGLHTETARLGLTLSTTPAVDVAGLLDELDRYPYGCLEQLTSRAYPLLYANQLARDWGLRQDPLLEYRVQAAIYQVLEKQGPDGGFALWRQSSASAEDIWLSSYALEFLWQARQAGQQVPERALQRGQKWLQQRLRYPGEDAATLAGQAYAHYVLALMGVGRAEDLRYLLKQRLERLPTPLALGQAAAALAMLGDSVQAKDLFQRAMDMPERQLHSQDYGSMLRDQAGLIHLLVRSGLQGLDVAPLWARVLSRQQASRWLSTQEQAWLILAATTLEFSENMLIERQDRPLERVQRPLRIQADASRLASGLHLVNRGDTPVWLVQQVHGSPVQQRPLAQSGLDMKRRWFRPDGTELVNPEQLQQGEALIVLVEGSAQKTGLERRLLLVDLLPAGLEVEMASLKAGADQGQFPWLPTLTALRYSDGLDDRVISAMDMAANENGFAVAYQLRAVSPGRFFWPPAVAEDMYRPDFRGQTSGLSLEVDHP